MANEIDFEAISDACGVEINSELSPHVIHKILKQRIDSMTKSEAATVPGAVWQQISMLDVTGDLVKKATVPSGQESGHEWVNVVALPPSSFMLLPIADAKNFVELLTSKHGFVEWVSANGISVTKEDDGIIISGQHLAGLSENFVSKVIASF